MDESLKKYAKKEAGEFYLLPNQKRRCSIVVKGRNYSKREEFMNYLRQEIGQDTFVVPIEQYPDPIKQYIIDLDKQKNEWKKRFF